MSVDKGRRCFLTTAASTAVSLTLGGSLASCGSSGGGRSTEFKYGVASGDPLSDRVMLWTHAKSRDSEDSVGLTWQVAGDEGFTDIVCSGRAMASAATAFTAKVDAMGLRAGTDYFYRFIADGSAASPVGITRTLPGNAVTSLKLAVFSCALYSEGYFNAYAAAAASDAQYALHLGDYIYEYGASPSAFGNLDAQRLGRVVQPANDLLTLDDYRRRYAQYRADPDLQALHARMPWIAVWDDHEFADNAYAGGAANHQPSTQGDWSSRRSAAARAYHEWMPLRTPDPGNLLKIYRRFDFGRLFTLHMLDTRSDGRDRQYDNFGDSDRGMARYLAATTPDAQGVRADAARQMMSAEQSNWLGEGLTRSTATWQILGSQVIMARMCLPSSLLQTLYASSPSVAAVQQAVSDYLTAKSLRALAGGALLSPTQAALLNPVTNPRIPYNFDAWDGYPSSREALLQRVKAQHKKLVVLSGDSHNAWFANLTTAAGEKVGVEFAGTSVSSPGLESLGLDALESALDGRALAPLIAGGAGPGLIDDLLYCDIRHRGYLLVSIDSDAIKGEYVYVSTVKDKAYSVSIDKTIRVAASTFPSLVP